MTEPRSPVDVMTSAIMTLGRGLADDESPNEYRRKCAEAVRIIAEADDGETMTKAMTEAIMRCGPAVYAAALHRAASSVMGPNAVNRVMTHAADIMSRKARGE